MTSPDFKVWADNIVALSQINGAAREEIERALQQAYDQGYQLGINEGWAIEQDKYYYKSWECDCLMCSNKGPK